MLFMFKNYEIGGSAVIFKDEILSKKVLDVFCAVLLLILSLNFRQNALAHGEDQPGPNGGEIRMPGAFHTEVIAEKNGFRVFLLDMNFQNPAVKNSSVELTYNDGKKNEKANCAVDGNSFFCRTANISTQRLKGELKLKVSREGALGNEAIYKLPLLSKASKPSGGGDKHQHGHSGH